MGLYLKIVLCSRLAFGQFLEFSMRIHVQYSLFNLPDKPAYKDEMG